MRAGEEPADGVPVAVTSDQMFADSTTPNQNYLPHELGASPQSHRKALSAPVVEAGVGSRRRQRQRGYPGTYEATRQGIRMAKVRNRRDFCS